MSLSETEAKKLKGLSHDSVARKIKRDGYNELPSLKKRGLLAISKDVLKEPMLILLIACSGLYLFLGSVEEAMILLLSIFVVVGITIYQENKTENALDALKNMASPRAMVIRDGEQKIIPGREVVKSDILIIKEGDRVPADAVIAWERNLEADESLLTGESVPVRKISSDIDSYQYCRPGGEDLPFIYSGSMIIQGEAVAKVINIGSRSELGKIGKVLGETEDAKTPLQAQTEKIVKVIFVIVIILCLVVAGVYGIFRNDWIHGILAGLTLAMSILPEEIPVVLTVFLALGAWRIAKKKALARKIAAIEILGAATVLCVDKTGTLTSNVMEVRKIFCRGNVYDFELGKKDELPEGFHDLVEYAILASKKNPYDSMEKAIKKIGAGKLKGTHHLHEAWEMVKEYPLTRQILALSYVWRDSDSGEYIVSTKGAAEAIVALCHLSEKEKKDILVRTDDMAKEGFRVLGVARSKYKKEELPESQHGFDFEFLGLIGLADPVRRCAPEAIKECYNAGIRVIMITGDYPATAQKIAKEIGLRNYEETITGPALEKMNPDELKKRIKTVNVFSRIMPEQKLFIVNALKSAGEIAAMTGDGVNDAPALKSAHIGIAMGERGTDVAREASDLVLMDDNFATIVAAVKQGRRIYDNLKKAIAYIVSVHVPIAGLTMITVSAGWPAVFFPVHVVFLEILIDPACSLIFEAEREESNIMKRPPRDSRKPLIGKNVLTISFLQGLFSLVAVAGVYIAAMKMGQSETQVRTLAFTTLVISNICLILTNRSWTRSIIETFSLPNKSVYLIIPSVLILLFSIIYTPFLRKIFQFDVMHANDILISFGAGILSILWFEIIKKIFAAKKIELLQE